MPRPAAAIIGIVTLAVGPFALAWGGVFLEHLSPWHSQLAELLFVIAGVVIGVIGVWLLPIKRLYRGLLTGPYVVAMALAILFSLVPLVCGFFGDCL